MIPHLNCLDKMVQMRGYNIWFQLEIRKIIIKYSLLSRALIKHLVHVFQKYQVWTERQPLRFYDRELLPHLVHVTRRLAKFVGMCHLLKENGYT